MSDTEAKPEEGNEPITIRVKDQTGKCDWLFFLTIFLIDDASLEEINKDVSCDIKWNVGEGHNKNDHY